MRIDPITLELIRNKFDVTANEMQTSLIRSSYSSIVKEAFDASSALFNIKGETIAQATALPIHLGMLIPAVKKIIEVFPPFSDMNEGDIFVLNDPYEGGTHLPDIIMVTPVIYKGRPVALSCTITHHQDMGGRTPGSCSTEATEIFQEGLRIPPIRLYDRGTLNKTLYQIIERNVRTPDIVLGDLRAQISAINTGKHRFLELIEAYDIDTILGCVEELLNYSEAMTRKGIEKIPDGVYKFVDYLDNDGIDLERKVKIEVEITIKGSDIMMDFTGSDPQVKGPLNCVESSTLAAVYYSVRALAGPNVPNNSGCYRPIKYFLPQGSIVNCKFPASVAARAITVTRILDTIFGALSQAIPDKIPACSCCLQGNVLFGGIDPLSGERFINCELATGGMGARSTKDGLEAIKTDLTNTMNVPVEAFEMSTLFRVLRYNLRNDSGGAGEYRGGLGFEKVFELLRGEVTVTNRGERNYTKSWGVYGGLPGKECRAEIIRSDGRVEVIPSKGVFNLKEGDKFFVYTGGGGGYGNPLRRKKESVLMDVVNKKVSVESAKKEYGVVIYGEDHVMKINHEETDQLRGELLNK